MARASSHFRFALRHVQWKPDRAAAAAGAPRHLDDDGVRAPSAQLSRARPSEADVCKAECRGDSDRVAHGTAEPSKVGPKGRWAFLCALCALRFCPRCHPACNPAGVLENRDRECEGNQACHCPQAPRGGFSR